jgi:FkbH-like protein
MKETADRGASVVGVAVPSEALAAFAETRAAVADRSVIAWGEHCTECAFPACYSECSFYTPREDHHCRRFEHGIQRAANPLAPDLDLTRIVFRRWGKLEGRGRVALRPAKAASSAERRDRWTDAALAAPLPASVVDKLRWRINEKKRADGAKGEAIGSDDVFVLEAFHDGLESWPFTLSIMTGEKEASGLFQAAAPLAPGYNRLIVPARDIAAFVDLSQPITVQVEPVREGSPAILFGLIDFARLSRPLAAHPGKSAEDRSKGPPKFKCVVWDLDHTLWRGVLVEDGIEGVELSEEAVALVKEFDRRGIINSIASKNDGDMAFKALEHFGLRDYFCFPKISWGPKSEAIRQTIADMDVGGDTFAFIDDQPFERGEVAQLLPEVTVFADTEMESLLDDPRFDVPVTAESGKRRQMYQTEERRAAAREGTVLDYAEFLRTCDIGLTVTRLGPANLARMYELSQRTNQLNFSGLRYTLAELEALKVARPQDAFVMSCADKFGEYGAIGFCVLAADRPMVDSFFMSCRVQRKRVENAFFQLLGAELKARGARRFEVRYKATAKNGASVQMLKDLGFAFEPGAADGEGLFVRSLAEPFPDHDVVSLIAELAIITQPRQAVA